MMRVSVTASANFSGSSAKPGARARTITGISGRASASSATCTSSIRCRPVGEGPGCAVLGVEGGVGRHEGDVEGPLAEDRAKMVRQPEGHHEGVGDRAGAHHGGHEHVAQEAGGRETSVQPPTERMLRIMRRSIARRGRKARGRTA